VLSHLCPGLVALGYAVESGKTKQAKIHRPVLFGENRTPSVNYEIDAFHDELGIAVEVEADRGATGNADYRDIVRTSLILDARHMNPTVLAAAIGVGGTVIVGVTGFWAKSLAGVRWVSIPAFLLADIAEHSDQFTGTADDCLVFTGPKRCPATAQRLFTSVAQSAGSGRLDWHPRSRPAASRQRASR